MTKSILLASFVGKDRLYEALDKIAIVCKLNKEQIFVFLNETNPSEYILTYNLYANLANIKFTSIWENTISVHRKKQTNTLYSLNAMNELIKQKNGGEINKQYRIDWSQYENKLLIIRNGRLKIIPIRMVKLNQ